MVFPKKFNSKSGELNFRLTENPLEYLTDISVHTKPYILVTYVPETKTFVVEYIDKGSKENIVKGVTRKTLEAAIENFEIEEIKFIKVRDERTSRVFKKCNQKEGSIIEISDYQESPFLNALYEVGFDRYKTNMFQNLNPVEYYLSAYKI